MEFAIPGERFGAQCSGWPLTANNNLNMMHKEVKVGNPKELTRAEIIRTANKFRWQRKMPKWTTIVEGRELPARPLVLEAAGVPPNDPTNSHQAVDILKGLGFETRYSREGRNAGNDKGIETEQTGKGWGSIIDIVSAASKEVPDSVWEQLPRDFAENIDHYLYGSKKQKGKTE